MQSYTEVDEEDLYVLKINCKEKRTVGKANEGISVEKYNRFKKLKILKEKKTEEERKKGKNGKLHKTAKAQHRVRGL